MNEIVVGLILGIIVAVIFLWWIGVARRRRRARLLQDVREGAEAEREKQLRAAKGRGDFDR